MGQGDIERKNEQRRPLCWLEISVLFEDGMCFCVGRPRGISSICNVTSRKTFLRFDRADVININTRAWLKCGTVSFLVQMWNSSCASICASNGQEVNSTYSRHLSLSNKIKFIMKLSSHLKEMAKKEKEKTDRN
jgi:hypothetical protein